MTDTSHATAANTSDSIRVVSLRCGMPIVCERVDGARSASVSWLIPAGVIHEEKNRLGMSSVVSEMLLRGAGDHSSRDLADAFDMLGTLRGSSNGGRFMSLTATTVGSKLDDSIALLAQMVLSPHLAADALEPVRDLARQSLASLQDEPQQRAVLAARARHLPEPFGRNSYGSEEGIAAITRDEVTEWWTRHAVPHGSVLSIAGDIDADRTAARLEEALGDWSGQVTDPEPGPVPARGYAHETDDSNQVQIMVVSDGPPETSPDADMERLVIAVLSGGMSGRLFTEVREERGLCYAVSASYRADQDRGVVSGYVGTTPERAQESLDVLLAELDKINTGDVTQEELDRARIGLRSRITFSGESTSARAGAIGSDFARLGRARTLQERTARLDSIGLDELNAYLRRRPSGTRTIQTLGPDALTPPGG